MCQEHARQDESGPQLRPHCEHASGGDTKHQPDAQSAEPDVISRSIVELAASPSAAETNTICVR